MSVDTKAFIKHTLIMAERVAYDDNTDPTTKQLLINLITIVAHLQLYIEEKETPL